LTDEFELLRAWREGNGTAGNQLFDQHFGSLYRYFRNKVPDNAEDLVQQTFLRCVQSRDSFRGDSSFRTYLFGVARNTLYTHLEKRQRTDGRIDWTETSCVDLGVSPSGVIARHEEQRILLLALRRLPVATQIALELYFFEELRGPKLAEILGVPEGTVRSRLRRGQLMLRKELERITDDPGLLESTVSGLEDWARDLREQLAARTA